MVFSGNNGNVNLHRFFDGKQAKDGYTAQDKESSKDAPSSSSTRPSSSSSKKEGNLSQLGPTVHDDEDFRSLWPVRQPKTPVRKPSKKVPSTRHSLARDGNMAPAFIPMGDSTSSTDLPSTPSRSKRSSLSLTARLSVQDGGACGSDGVAAVEPDGSAAKSPGSYTQVGDWMKSINSRSLRRHYVIQQRTEEKRVRETQKNEQRLQRVTNHMPHHLLSIAMSSCDGEDPDSDPVSPMSPSDGKGLPIPMSLTVNEVKSLSPLPNSQQQAVEALQLPTIKLPTTPSGLSVQEVPVRKGSKENRGSQALQAADVTSAVVQRPNRSSFAGRTQTLGSSLEEDETPQSRPRSSLQLSPGSRGNFNALGSLSRSSLQFPPGLLSRSGSRLSSRCASPEETKKPTERHLRRLKTENTINLSRKHSIALDSVQAARQEFENMDVDSGGSLSFDEFQSKLRNRLKLAEDQEIPQGLIMKSWGEADKDGDGALDFEEFLLWRHANTFHQDLLVEDEREKRLRDLARKFDLSIPEIEDIKKVFDNCDKDRSGFIEKAEFKNVLTKLLGAKSSELPENRLDRYWREIDRDHSGNVTLEEFLDWYLRYIYVPKGEADDGGIVTQTYACLGINRLRRASYSMG